MASGVTALEHALFILGQEDLIPIPEVMTVPEVVDSTDPARIHAEVAGALAKLADRSQVGFWLGSRNAKPDPIPSDDAVLLLRDPYYFRFHPNDPAEQRLYYVNVQHDLDADD
jgi:hypothetical protein